MRHLLAVLLVCGCGVEPGELEVSGLAPVRVLSPADAGHHDAGSVDAGVPPLPDAGVDAGQVVRDAGVPDAGTDPGIDAGGCNPLLGCPVDAGAQDAGVIDAGAVDAGSPAPDAGPPHCGALGEPTCSGFTCDAGLYPDFNTATPTCTNCGATSDVCCTGFACNTAGVTCLGVRSDSMSCRTCEPGLADCSDCGTTGAKCCRVAAGGGAYDYVCKAGLVPTLNGAWCGCQ